MIELLKILKTIKIDKSALEPDYQKLIFAIDYESGLLRNFPLAFHNTLIA